MRGVFPLIAALAVALAAPVGAVSLSEASLSRMDDAEIILLGEVHDNPSHHAAQADLVARIAPRAVVYEMLSPEQAGMVTPQLLGDADALATALDWSQSGWSDFAMYHPIFLAAPDAVIFGAAVPRDAARASMQRGIAAAFGPEAAVFGLADPLSETEQAQREALQFDAHCEALPRDLLPTMVDIQRLRDARLAQEALIALERTGGPVVVITGNGHARADWGVPRFLRQVRGGIRIFTLGQTEDGAVLPGAFDAVLDAPSVARPDPCDAFRN